MRSVSSCSVAEAVCCIVYQNYLVHTGNYRFYSSILNIVRALKIWMFFTYVYNTLFYFSFFFSSKVMWAKCKNSLRNENLSSNSKICFSSSFLSMSALIIHHIMCWPSHINSNFKDFAFVSTSILTGSAFNSLKYLFICMNKYIINGKTNENVSKFIRKIVMCKCKVKSFQFQIFIFRSFSENMLCFCFYCFIFYLFLPLSLSQSVCFYLFSYSKYIEIETLCSVQYLSEQNEWITCFR